MNCNKTILLLSPYADGELPKDEASEIKKHIESCENCKYEVELIKRMKDYGKDLEFSAPLDIGEKIIKGVKAREEKKKSTKPLPKWVFYWKAYIVIVLLLLMFLLIRNGINNRTADPTADEIFNYSYEYKSETIEAERADETENIEPEKPEEAKKADITNEVEELASNNATDNEATPAVQKTNTTETIGSTVPKATTTPKVTTTPKATTTPKPTATPQKTGLQKKKEIALGYTVSKGGSLQKLKINFLLYNDEEQEKALSVYNSLSSKDEVSVGKALSNAGIAYSKSTIVVNDYTADYNKVVNDMNAIKERVSSATTESQVDKLISQLDAKNDELTAIKNKCITVTGITIRQ